MDTPGRLDAGSLLRLRGAVYARLIIALRMRRVRYCASRDDFGGDSEDAISTPQPPRAPLHQERRACARTAIPTPARLHGYCHLTIGTAL
jgi:hypothetical protein